MDSLKEDKMLCEEIKEILVCTCERCELRAPVIISLMGAVLVAQRDVYCSVKETKKCIRDMVKASETINKHDENAMRVKLEGLEIAELATRFKLSATHVELNVFMANVCYKPARAEIRRLVCRLAKSIRRRRHGK